MAATRRFTKHTKAERERGERHLRAIRLCRIEASQKTRTTRMTLPMMETASDFGDAKASTERTRMKPVYHPDERCPLLDWSLISAGKVLQLFDCCWPWIPFFPFFLQAIQRRPLTETSLHSDAKCLRRIASPSLLCALALIPITHICGYQQLANLSNAHIATRVFVYSLSPSRH